LKMADLLTIRLFSTFQAILSLFRTPINSCEKIYL
jgi:hypothetical protein